MGLNIEWPVDLMFQVSFLTMHGWTYETRWAPYTPGQDYHKADPLGEGWYKEGFTHRTQHLYDEVTTLCFRETQDAFSAEQQAIEDATPKPEKKTRKKT